MFNVYWNDIDCNVLKSNTKKNIAALGKKMNLIPKPHPVIAEDLAQ